jgi:hypothetical protein
MTLSRRTITLGTAAALIALAGVEAVSSAPSPVAAEPTGTVRDDAWRPGMDGVDVAAITGPKGTAAGKVPACADPARRGDLRPC